jgi:hypothetical protein
MVSPGLNGSGATSGSVPTQLQRWFSHFSLSVIFVSFDVVEGVRDQAFLVHAVRMAGVTRARLDEPVTVTPQPVQQCHSAGLVALAVNLHALDASLGYRQLALRALDQQ